MKKALIGVISLGATLVVSAATPISDLVSLSGTPLVTNITGGVYEPANGNWLVAGDVTCQGGTVIGKDEVEPEETPYDDMSVSNRMTVFNGTVITNFAAAYPGRDLDSSTLVLTNGAVLEADYVRFFDRHQYDEKNSTVIFAAGAQLIADRVDCDDNTGCTDLTVDYDERIVFTGPTTRGTIGARGMSIGYRLPGTKMELADGAQVTVAGITYLGRLSSALHSGISFAGGAKLTSEEFYAGNESTLTFTLGETDDFTAAPLQAKGVSIGSDTTIVIENPTVIAKYMGTNTYALVKAETNLVALTSWLREQSAALPEGYTLERNGNTIVLSTYVEPGLSISGLDRPCAGKELKAAVTAAGDCSYVWKRGDIDGNFDETPVGSEVSYKLSTADYEHWIQVGVVRNGQVLATSKVWVSRLPVVYIDTDNHAVIASKETYLEGDLRIQGNDDFKEQYNGRTEVKGRGNSTWSWPKKPYKLKLDKKADLFGMGNKTKNKHWVLLANFLDNSSLRNTLAQEFARNEATNMPWVPGFQPVDLILNGKYNGLYLLGQHVRLAEERINIHDWEDEATSEEDFSNIDPAVYDISGGYIFELSKEMDSVSQFYLTNNCPMMINTPEYLYTNPSMMEFCSNEWNEAVAAWSSMDGYAPSGRRIADIFDVDSFIDYWIVNEFFGNDDAIQKSRYASQDIGKKIKFGPTWDFDWGCGAATICAPSNSTKVASYWHLAYNGGDSHCGFYCEFLDNPDICFRAWKRFCELMPKFEAMMAEGGAFDQDAARVDEAGLADDLRWYETRKGYFTYGGRDYVTDRDAFRTYLNARIAFIKPKLASFDTFYQSYRSSSSAHPYTPSAATKMGITCEDGKTLTIVNGSSVTTSLKIMLDGEILTILPCAVSSTVTYKIPAEALAKIPVGEQRLVEVIGYQSSGESRYYNHCILTRTTQGVQILLY